VSRASQEALSHLHAQLALVLKDALGKVDGETGLPSAAILSVARQYLKDNYISADASAAASPLGQLVAGMPSFDEEGNVVPIRKEG